MFLLKYSLKFFFAGWLVACQTFVGQAATPSPCQPHSVFLKIGQEVVSHHEFGQRLRLMAFLLGIEEASQETLKRLKPFVKRLMIEEKLQAQETSRKGLTLSSTSPEIVGAIQDIEKGYGMPSNSFLPYLEAKGITPSLFTNQLKARVLWTRYMRQKYGDTAYVNPLSVQKIQEKIKKSRQFDQYQISEMRLYTSCPQEKGPVLRQAQQLIQTLQKKKIPFPALAMLFSQGPTHHQGGFLGWVSCQDLDKPLQRAFSKKPPQKENLQGGLVYGPLPMEYGYLIVCVSNHKKAHAFKDAAVPSGKEIEQSLRSLYINQMARRDMNQLRFSTFVQEMP